MPMRTDCAHFKTRTFANGETVSFCELGLAPEAPWRCPENCPEYDNRMAGSGWKGVGLAGHKAPDEPDLEGAAELLGETEGILRTIDSQLSKEQEAQRARQYKKDQKKYRRQQRRQRLAGFGLGWARLFKVVLLLAVLGGIVYVAVRPEVLDGVPVIGPKKTGSTIASGAGWDQDVWPVVQAVQRERGLDFKHPVKVKLLAQDAFAQVAARENRPSPAEQNHFRNKVATMRALGLVQGDFDPLANSSEFINQDILGFYKPQTKTVYVRGIKATGDVREALAHELTHALDDQYFDIGKRYNLPSSGPQEAFRALTEGNAVRVQEAYSATLSAVDQNQYDTSVSEVTPEHPDAPDVFKAIFSFPYVFGPTYVQALVDHDGEDAVDRAFKNPPVSEAEIVAPSMYLDHRKPVQVRVPYLAPGQQLLEKPDDFGQMLMFLVLGDRLDYGTAWGAVQGWAGDSSVTYRQGQQTCIAVATASRAPADADKLLAATQKWAAAVPGATVNRTGDIVELRSCDPGKAAPPHASIKPSALEVLAIRAGIVRELREHSHMPQPVAECTADGILARVGPGQFTGLENQTGDLARNDPRAVSIQKASTQAATVCFGKT